MTKNNFRISSGAACINESIIYKWKKKVRDGMGYEKRADNRGNGNEG